MKFRDIMSFITNLWGSFRSGFGYATPYKTENDFPTTADECWDPRLRSTDGSVIGAKPFIEARIKSLIERDGFLSGAVESHVNAVVGNGLKLNYQPDWEALGQSQEWADDFQQKIELRWKRATQGRKLDAGRKHNWPALQAQAYRSFLISGEITAVPKFKRSGDQRTTIMLIDPNRIKNPFQATNKEDVRAGIKLSDDGEPLVYYIYNKNPLDPQRGRQRGADEFEAVGAYNRRGRKRVIHVFDPVGTEQTRGISMFAPVVETIKRQHDLSDAMLKAAIYQTLTAAVIKSDLNYEQAMMVAGSAGASTPSSSFMTALQQYMGAHASFYENQRIKVGDLQLHHLMPNEDLELKSAGAVSSEYESFAKTLNREAARGVGLSLESYTGDWAELSFSGGQLSGGYMDRGHFGRRERVMSAFCQDVFELWLEELFIKEPGLLPSSVDFYSNRDALSAAIWMGPPPVLADPVKTAEAAETRIENMITTRANEFAAIGLDFDDAVKQMEREQTKIDGAGLRNPKLEETVLKQEELKKGDVQGEKKS